jgi:hypothetical protein
MQKQFIPSIPDISIRSPAKMSNVGIIQTEDDLDYEQKEFTQSEEKSG